LSTDGNPSGGSNKSWQSDIGRSSSYLGFGAQLAVSMLLYVVGGYLLDRWLGTTPWLLVTGAVIGMIAFFFQLARIARRLTEESEQRKKEARKED
jgi:F0F1-type ATP synthase assembly protein I